MPTDRPLDDEPISPDELPTVVAASPVGTGPVARDAVVTAPLVIEEPLLGSPDGASVAAKRVVTESQAEVVGPDGTVTRSRKRVAGATVVARRRPSWLWPCLALLALALIIGLVAWWYFSERNSKRVPNVVGSSLTTAVNRLQRADFKTSISRSADPVQAGIVFAQDPSASTSAKKGSVVHVAVSNGPSLIAVPSAVGLTDAAARQSLTSAGFRVTEVRVFSGQAAGTVIAQSPAAGDKVAPNQRIRINVSKGSGTAVVPNAVGLGDVAARSSLVAAGFRVTEARVPSSQPAGTVIAQSPVAGTHSASGSIVRINVAAAALAAPTTTTTPSATTAPVATTPATTTTAPVGTPAATTSPTRTQSASAQVPTVSGALPDAVQKLAAAGFRVSIAYVPGSAELGTVLAQNPAAGSTAPTGSHVTINLSSGPNQVASETVPDLVGKTIPEGVAILNRAGLRLIFLRVPVTTKAAAGTIVEQTPTPGTSVPKNAQVLVYMGAYKQ